MDRNHIALQPSERGDEVELPTEPPVHHERFAGFGDREKLIADLTVAVEPGSPPTVMAVFELVGWGEHRRLFGAQASDGLTARLAEAFALVVRPVGACYYMPREDEFCALISRPIDDATSTLFAAEAALNDDAAASLITASFGATFLPEEAANPNDALTLADERLRVRTVSRQPRERRKNNRAS